MRSDSELVRATQRDETAAFSELIDRHADRIHTFAYGRLRNSDEAAQVVRSTFVQARRRVEELVPGDLVLPRLYSIARTAAEEVESSAGRHARRRDWGPVGGRPRRRAGRSGPSNASDRFEPVETDAATLLWDAAAGFPGTDRDLLELHLRAGLSGAELAVAMGNSAADLPVMINRLVRRLDDSVGSLLLARLGRDDCVALDGLLRDWNGIPSLAVRSTVARHADHCQVCRATGRAAISWPDIARAMPARPLPASVRLAVLNAVAAESLTTAPNRPGGPGDDQDPADQDPAGQDRADQDDVATAEPDPEPADDEQPTSGSGRGPRGRFSLRRLLFAAAIIAGAVVTAILLAQTIDDDGDVTVTDTAPDDAAPANPTSDNAASDNAAPDNAAPANPVPANPAPDDPAPGDDATEPTDTTESEDEPPSVTTLPPNTPLLFGSLEPLATGLPTGAGPAPPTVYRFANVGDIDLPWSAAVTGSFTVEPTEGVVAPRADTTILVGADAAAADNPGELVIAAGDQEIRIGLTAVPTDIRAVELSWPEVWEDAGDCADEGTWLPNRVEVVVTAAAESVVIRWDGETSTLPMEPTGNPDEWSATVGPYQPPEGAATDVLVVGATSAFGFVSTANKALTINACT